MGVSMAIPGRHDASRSGNIGPISAVNPGVFEGPAAKYRLSLAAIIKSLLQSAAVAPMGLAIALLCSMGLHFGLFWSVSLAAMLHEIALKWLGWGWSIVRFHFWKNAWDGARRMILYPAAQGWSYYLMFAGVVHFAGDQVPYFVYFLPALLSSFFRRLFYNSMVFRHARNR